MKAAIYARVSTEDQDPDNQIRVLEEWAGRRSWDIAYILRESDSAWRSGHQSQLAELTRLAQRGRYKILLVWSLDRLTREGPLAILTRIHKLRQYGVQVISHQEPWTEAPGELSELLLAITGWIANMESVRRSERTKAGLERVRSQGKRLGRPPGSRDKVFRKRRPRVYM